MTPFTTRRHGAPLVAAGVLLALYPAVRPWGDATPAGAPAAFASAAWPVAHLAAVAGFGLVAVGLLRLRDAVGDGSGTRSARWAVGTWWLGTVLVLPYYGAETFALHALAVAGKADPALVEAVRMGPLQLTVFGIGLAAFGAAGVLAAVTVAGSATTRRWGGSVFAAGFALYLPQFFAAPELRIAHGVLVAVGCLLLAASRPRTSAPTRVPGAPGPSDAGQAPVVRTRRVTAARAASSSSGG